MPDVVASPVPDVPPDLRDPKTPKEVIITLEARRPETDPTLGIQVEVQAAKDPAHRLVTIGDSLTHGFQSGAIFNTDLSFPALIARELGCYDTFRRPEYRGYGGLGLNIEWLVRSLTRDFGPDIPWWEAALALFDAHHLLAQSRDYWENGAGSHIPPSAGIMHNLGVAGFDLRDVLSLNADIERKRMKPPPDSWIDPLVANASALMGLYVLDSAKGADGRALSAVEAAQELGSNGGIETLIVFIGANNALGAIIDLKVCWSDVGFDDPDQKWKYNVWLPSHFKQELNKLADAVRKVNARHVIWCTVPHVTIAPLARGLGQKMRPGSRYFPYYTRPWIDEASFDASRDPYITGNQARAIDSAIDQYNTYILDAVKAGRNAKLDWLLLDTAGLLDRIATRRYMLDPAARPYWWTPYQLPPALAALTPPPDSRFFSSGPGGRAAGGIFALDGVHPTTIIYGVLAQELINVMSAAGVTFLDANKKARPVPVQIDFAALIRLDTLISDPPAGIASDMKAIAWANRVWDWIGRLGQMFRR